MNSINLNKAVFTVKNVVNRSEAILYVVRDSDDDLQFLTGGAVSMDDMMMVSLGEVLQIDPTVGNLNLERGYEASRNTRSGAWEIRKAD